MALSQHRLIHKPQLPYHTHLLDEASCSLWSCFLWASCINRISDLVLRFTTHICLRKLGTWAPPLSSYRLHTKSTSCWLTLRWLLHSKRSSRTAGWRRSTIQRGAAGPILLQSESVCAGADEAGGSRPGSKPGCSLRQHASNMPAVLPQTSICHGAPVRTLPST